MNEDEDIIQDFVMKIYPNAKCFQWLGSYAIMDIPDKDMFQILNYEFISTNTPFYSKWQNTAHLAWMDAWEQIQLKMLKKLEE
jgi:hypothetical protein